jgi:hypothetical protein
VDFVFYFFQNAQAFGETWPAKAADRSAIGFVVGSFKDEWDIQRAGHALDDFRYEERVFFALDDAGAGNQKQIAGADADALDLE